MKPGTNRRLRLWQALSLLFLDTEITVDMYNTIAHEVVTSGFSPEEVRSILWHELFPVLKHNLRSITGEWAGWSDAWLLENIHVRPVLPHPRLWSGAAREISRCWADVAVLLPPAYR